MAGTETQEVIPKAQPNTRQGRSIELVVAAILGTLALACFVGQELTVGAHTTATETFLFNGLQFILTAGFAWFSTRAISRIEFEQSLKKFAISAYRRIADIERMVDRLQQEIRDMISDMPKSDPTNLRIVDAIVSDTAQLVRSSISDWGDVIGEELLAIERIKRLEREKELLHKDEVSAKAGSEIEIARKDIEEAIATIQRTLPPRLQLEADSEALAAQSTRRAGQWLARQHRDQDGLRMTIVTGSDYLSERDRNSLKTGEILFADKNEGGSIDVRDKDGLGVRRLQNPTPLTYDNFVKCFGQCYGAMPISLEFLSLEGEKTYSETAYAWIAVKVVTTPMRYRARPTRDQLPKGPP
jgi:hypothetical protein